MKFSSSSSPSVSSTTTTTTTTNTNISSSKTTTTTGCLSGVLRRLLCFNTLPTYPSDQIKDEQFTAVDNDDHKLQFSETEQMVAPPVGVVARLMGLDSMPRIDVGNTQLTPNSISRSRSMNSVDSRKELESVKTSLSFRETPTFLELDEFFVISFETKKPGSKGKKCDVGIREMKCRKTESNRRQSVYERNYRENIETNKMVVSDEKQNRKINHRASKKICGNGFLIDSSNILRPTKNSNGNSHVVMEVEKQLKPMNYNGDSGGVKSRKKKKKKKKKKQKEIDSVAKKAQTECDSENSSPVSVLDFGVTDLTAPISEEDSRLKNSNSNSRRKLLELEKKEQSHTSHTDNGVRNEKEAKHLEGIVDGSRKKDQQNENYAEVWCEICKMVAQELKESKWVYRDMWKLEDIEEDKVADFGFQILQELLNEVVDQLAGTSSEEVLVL